MLVFVGAVVASSTGAFFSDTETSTGNTFTAGNIDLQIDNTSYAIDFNIPTFQGTPTGALVANPANSWNLADLVAGTHKFFSFRDLKPGDLGEDTISIHVGSNNAWMCAAARITDDSDQTCTEPEQTDENGACVNPGPNLGELDSQLHFVFWADDGDNVYEDGEAIFKSGTAAALFDGTTWTLADSSGSIWPTPGPLPANSDRYIGKFWCLGTLTPAPVANPQDVHDPTLASGFTCDGQALNNASQTDKLLADVQFTAVQARHNTGFVCAPNGPTPTPTPPIITPTLTPTPTLAQCQQADVMLVLDRSGSISSTELASLKTAATDFVTALGLSDPGVHAGMSSFATTGSLDHILSFNAGTLNASINALVSTGFTNLSAGINLATGELTGVNDRPDVSSPDAMIVVTDGHPNRPLPSGTAPAVAATSADNARAAGVEVYVVGVGGDVDATYLTNDIADDAAHYFSVADYSALETTLQNLDLCQ